LLRQEQTYDKDQVQSIVDPIMLAVDEVTQASNARVAADLVRITRQTVSVCLKIVKISQTGGDLDTAQSELQATGSQFNRICRDFNEYVQSNAARPASRAVKNTAPTPIARVEFSYVGYHTSEKGCIIEIHNKPQYDKLISNTSRIVAVMVTIHSPICDHAKEYFKELAEANPHADFLVMDQNEMGALIPGISEYVKVPHYLFYKEGKLVKDFGGQFQEHTLQAAVSTIVVKARPKTTPKAVATSGLHTPGQVLAVSSEDLYRAVLGTPETLIIVNFYDHEKISQDMIPAFAKCAGDYLGVIFASVDVNACKKSIKAVTASMRLPNFRFYRNGDKLKDWQGRDPEYLEGLIKQYYK